MRRTVLLLTGVLLSVVTLGSDSPKDYDESVQVYELEGTWREAGFTFLVYDGNSPEIDYTFRGNTWVSYHKNRVISSGTYKTDSSCQPAHLTVTCSAGRDQGKTSKCIYYRDGDLLRIASKGNETVRPKGFDDEGIVIFAYMRVKK